MKQADNIAYSRNGDSYIAYHNCYTIGVIGNIVSGFPESIFRITVPMIRGTIIMLAILQVGSIFRADFGLFYQLPQNSGALMNVSDVVDTYIFRTLMVTGNTSVSAAVGLVQSVVGLILVLLTNYIVGRIDSDSTLF